MDDFIAIFALENPSRLEDDFGKKIIAKGREALDNRFIELIEFLFSRNQFKSDSFLKDNHQFWAVKIKINTDKILLDLDEQIETLSRKGNLQLRKILREEFGGATGNKIKFTFKILSQQEFPEFSIKGIKKFINKEDFWDCKNKSKQFSFSENIEYKDFKNILDNEEINIYLQPLISIPEYDIFGYEVLTRGPKGQLFSAPDLFSAAEYFNLKEELEFLCIKKGLKWGLELPEDLVLTINSGLQLLKNKNLQNLFYIPEYNKIINRLIIEITEHLPLNKIKNYQDIFAKIRDKGIRLALDDTGCGFADINRLKDFKPNLVKLCITVINRLQNSSEVKAEIYNSLKKIRNVNPDCKILAEGVENKEQLNILEKMKEIDLVQGYYFDKPQPARKVIEKIC